MVGTTQLVIIAVIAVILIMGPRKIPQLGRSLGDAIRGFKKGVSGEDDDEIDVTASASEELRQSQEENQTSVKTEKKDKV